MKTRINIKKLRLNGDGYRKNEKNIEGTEKIKNGETKHVYVMSGYLKKFEVKTIELNNSG